MAFEIEQVKPIGERESPAFVDGVTESGEDFGEFRLMKFPVYPPAPRGATLRAFRVGGPGAAYVSIFEAAKLLGLKAVDVSALERGAARFVDEADWERAAKVLRPTAPAKEAARG